MLKKLLAVFVLLLFGASLSMAATSSIGHIDLQKVLKGYKETAKAQKDLDSKQKEYQSEVGKFQKDLADAEKAGKSEKDLGKMKEDMEKKLSSKQNELMQYNQQFNQNLQKRIIDASNSIAKKLGLDLIVDKQAVIVGGMDVTDLVITEINK